MAMVQGYPATRYTPEALVNFNSFKERKRLTGSSLIMFFNMMKVPQRLSQMNQVSYQIVLAIAGFVRDSWAFIPNSR